MAQTSGSIPRPSSPASTSHVNSKEANAIVKDLQSSIGPATEDDAAAAFDGQGSNFFRPTPSMSTL